MRQCSTVCNRGKWPLRFFLQAISGFIHVTFIVSSYLIMLSYPIPISVSDRLRKDYLQAKTSPLKAGLFIYGAPKGGDLVRFR